MDFDPSTAVLDEEPEEIGFDPSTAVPDDQAFDPNTAVLDEEPSVNPLKKGGIVDKSIERAGLGVAQGVYGLGRAAYGALGQEVQTLENIGKSESPVAKIATTVFPSLKGATELAQSDFAQNVKQYSQEVADIAGAQINEFQTKGDQVGGGMPGKISQLVGSGVVSIAPAVVTAPFGGLPLAAATAGLQSFGSTAADATDAYRAQGLTDEQARTRALVPSIASGLSTAVVTALGGQSGPEALGTLAKSSGFKKFAIDLLREAGIEGGEETVDQLIQSAIQKLSFNPDLTVDQAIQDSATSGLLGFGLGGAFKFAHPTESAHEAKANEFKAKIQNTVQQVENLEQSGLPQTAAVLAEQDKQKLVLEAVEEATTQPDFLGGLADEELVRRKEGASPEQARAIDEEIKRRTQAEQPVTEGEKNVQIQEPNEEVLRPESQGTGEGMVVQGMVGEDQAQRTSEQGQAQEITQPTETGLSTEGEVSNGEDLLDIIKNRESQSQATPTDEQAPETTIGENQPTPPSGTEVQPTRTSVQNSPEVQNQLAEGLQQLKPQLIKRASDLGVSDPEAVANDAILRAVKTAKNVDEAGKFANSTGIQQSIADTLRKEGAEGRRAQAGAVSLEEPVGAEKTIGETISGEQASPSEEAVQNEQRQIFDNYRDEFFQTLTPAEKAIWNQIHNAGTGRAPQADKINQIAAKFSRFLKSKGLRDIRAVPAVRKAPKNWSPVSDKTRQRLVAKYKLDKGITEALKALGSNSNNTYRALIAKFLSSRVRSNLALVPKQYMGFRPYDGLFGYNGQLPAVLLNMSNLSNDSSLEEILLHETVHAMTTDLVDIYQESPNLLTHEQRELLDGVNNIFKEAQKQLIGDESQVKETLKAAQDDPGFYDIPANRAIYGLTDLGEFISEAMSNPEFQHLLKSVRVDTPRKTVWKELIHAVKRLLGIKSNDVALDRAIEHIFSLVDEGKRFAQAQENVARGERQFKRSEIGKSKVTAPAESVTLTSDEKAATGPLLRGSTKESTRSAKEISSHLRGSEDAIDPASESSEARKARLKPEEERLLQWATDKGLVTQAESFPEEDAINEGAEHAIYEDPEDPNRVIKRSYPGEYGASLPYIDELGTLSLVAPLPSDYFDRIGTDNEYNDDDRKFLGLEVYPNGTFSILTSQPFIRAQSHPREGYTAYRSARDELDFPVVEGKLSDGTWEVVKDDELQANYGNAIREDRLNASDRILRNAGTVIVKPADKDIKALLESKGYKKIGTNSWINKEGVIFDDTHDGNFILTPDGSIVPIDVNVRVPSAREIQTLQRRFGKEITGPKLPGAAQAPAKLAENEEVQTLPTSTGMMQYGPIKSIADWTKENLTARGKFNEPTFNAMLARNQEAGAIMNKVENNIRELRRVLNKDDALTANAALKGDQEAFQALPENVQPIINDIRQDVDQMSRKLIDSGVLSEELTATVSDNLGVYLNRSYEIFDNPKFKEKAKNDPAWKQTMDDARAYLRKYLIADYATGYAKENSGIEDTSDDSPQWQAFEGTREHTKLLQEGALKAIDAGVASENEIEKELNKLLDVGEEAKQAGGQFSVGKPGRKNLNILKKRKDIPIEIRKLWGEYNDPYVNYVRTMSKMASLVTNHKFLSDVAADGLKNGWLWREDDANRPPETVPIVGKTEQNKAMTPLAGLYGDETLRQAFQEFNERSNNAFWVRALLGLTGVSMAAKTVGSVQGTIRNFIGNIIPAIANGHITNLGGYYKGARAVEANLISRTKDRKAWQEYFQKLVRLGIVSESAGGNTLRDLISRASKGNETQSLAENMADGMISKGSRLLNFAPKVYQSVDDFWKVLAYESEKSKYEKAFPEASAEEIDKMVAPIVRNVTFTYSQAPKIIQKLRRFPFIAPFITFTSEVVRTNYKIIGQIHKELSDPRTRDIGISRAVGIGVAHSLLAGVTMLLKSMLGFDDDDEDAIRQLAPEWQKNAAIMMFGKDGKGKISYADVSYIDPYHYIREPITALLRSKTTTEAMENVLTSIFKPILNEQILAGAIFDWRRNKTQTGQPVYNEQASWDEQAKDIAAHFWNAFEPGTVTSAKRLVKAYNGTIEPSGRSYKLGNELTAALGGQRITEIDGNQGLQQATRRFKSNNNEATTIFSTPYKSQGTIDLEDLKKKYVQADDAQFKIMRELRRAYEAAINLGIKPQQAIEALRGEKLGIQDVNQVKTGIYKQYVPSIEATIEAKKIDKNRQKALKEAQALVPKTRSLLSQ